MDACPLAVQVIFELNIGSAIKVEELKSQLLLAISSGTLKVDGRDKIVAIHGHRGQSDGILQCLCPCLLCSIQRSTVILL